MRSNFKKQRVKNAFKDIYLNALFFRVHKRKCTQLTKFAYHSINLESIRNKQVSHRSRQYYRSKLLTKTLKLLYVRMKHKKYLKKKHWEIRHRRCYWLKFVAMRQHKLYHRKMREFKADKIVGQFVDHEDAIICADLPGQPLVMRGEDDADKYFTVNSMVHVSCHATGYYQSRKKE